MEEFKNITTEKRNSLWILSLVNNEKLNPLDIETGDEINRALDVIEKDSARALLIRGTGRAFSAGGDVRGMRKSIADGDPGKFMDELTDRLYRIGLRLRKLPIPVIAEVNGAAVGAGMNLALSCDFIIASEDARFSQGFVKLALIPGFGGTHLLINQLPWQKAAEIAMLGEFLDANTMKELGFVNKVVSHDAVETESLEFAEKLASGPTLTFARTKQLFLQAMNTGYEAHMANERMVQVESAKTEDYKAGVESILSGEPPVFSGK